MCMNVYLYIFIYSSGRSGRGITYIGVVPKTPQTNTNRSFPSSMSYKSNRNRTR
jgi:hypothetical protein